MPRGGFRPGAGRPRKSRPGDDLSATAGPLRPMQVTAQTEPSSTQTLIDPTEVPPGRRDAMRFLTAVMRSKADIRLRIDAAKTLLPYQHPKIAEVGKKEQRNKDAQELAASKFTPGAPPKLIAAGGKKV